jgi:hypothetical protein
MSIAIATEGTFHKATTSGLLTLHLMAKRILTLKKSH